MIDKEIGRTFLNANPLYVQSLGAAFPQVKTVEDVIWKTDFDFYPRELAEKYRADDARVMASGERFETIEQYSEGDTLGYVYTEKTPLKDGAGKVFGLRVRFYLIPPPNQTVIPEAANAWERAHVQIIDKDTNSVFLNANPLFLSSVGSVFPEIRSVTNLIGRDDFAFYPLDLAEKFRADDARVIASGQEFSTVEEMHRRLGQLLMLRFPVEVSDSISTMRTSLGNTLQTKVDGLQNDVERVLEEGDYLTIDLIFEEVKNATLADSYYVSNRV